MATLLFASGCATTDKYELPPATEKLLASVSEQDRKRCEEFALADAERESIRPESPPEKPEPAQEPESAEESDITAGDVAFAVLAAPLVYFYLITFAPAGSIAAAIENRDKRVAQRQADYAANYASTIFLCLRPVVLSQLHGPIHRYVADSLEEFARYQMDRGRYLEAEELHRQALVIREEVLEPGHPDIENGRRELAESIRSRADDYVKQKRYGEAAELNQQALAHQEKVFGSEHSGLVQTLLAIAYVYLAQNQYDEAATLYARVLAIWEKTGVMEPIDFDRLNNIEQFAILLRDTERKDAARQILARVVSLEEKYDPNGTHRRLRCQRNWKRMCGDDGLEFPSIKNDLHPQQRYTCYTAAMRAGLTKLTDAREEVSAKLTEVQISKATKMADLWSVEDCQLEEMEPGP